MRLALLIFALIASPALAWDVPPEQPTYEQPTFEKPDTPQPPEPPQPPERPETPDEPREPLVTPIPPATAQACPTVTCITAADGTRKATFTSDVPAEMYKLGVEFCKYAPKDAAKVSACCLEKDGVYQIIYNMAVSKKAHYKAKKFCTCVYGLD